MRRLLDTNAILYLLGGRYAAPLETGTYFISVITELELLSYPSLNDAEERQIRSFLSKIIVLGLTKDIREKTIRLRKANRLKLPDAIIAATAITVEATLLTNDKSLLKLPGISAQSLDLK